MSWRLRSYMTRISYKIPKKVLREYGFRNKLNIDNDDVVNFPLLSSTPIKLSFGKRDILRHTLWELASARRYSTRCKISNSLLNSNSNIKSGINRVQNNRFLRLLHGVKNDQSEKQRAGKNLQKSDFEATQNQSEDASNGHLSASKGSRTESDNFKSQPKVRARPLKYLELVLLVTASVGLAYFFNENFEYILNLCQYEKNQEHVEIENLEESSSSLLVVNNNNNVVADSTEKCIYDISGVNTNNSDDIELDSKSDNALNATTLSGETEKSIDSIVVSRDSEDQRFKMIKDVLELEESEITRKKQEFNYENIDQIMEIPSLIEVNSDLDLLYTKENRVVFGKDGGVILVDKEGREILAEPFEIIQYLSQELEVMKTAHNMSIKNEAIRLYEVGRLAQEQLELIRDRVQKKYEIFVNLKLEEFKSSLDTEFQLAIIKEKKKFVSELEKLDRQIEVLKLQRLYELDIQNKLIKEYANNIDFYANSLDLYKNINCAAYNILCTQQRIRDHPSLPFTSYYENLKRAYTSNPVLGDLWNKVGADKLKVISVSGLNNVNELCLQIDEAASEARTIALIAPEDNVLKRYFQSFREFLTRPSFFQSTYRDPYSSDINHIQVSENFYSPTNFLLNTTERKYLSEINRGVCLVKNGQISGALQQFKSLPEGFRINNKLDAWIKRAERNITYNNVMSLLTIELANKSYEYQIENENLKNISNAPAF